MKRCWIIGGIVLVVICGVAIIYGPEIVWKFQAQTAGNGLLQEMQKRQEFEKGPRLNAYFPMGLASDSSGTGGWVSGIDQNKNIRSIPATRQNITLEGRSTSGIYLTTEGTSTESSAFQKIGIPTDAEAMTFCYDLHGSADDEFEMLVSPTDLPNGVAVEFQMPGNLGQAARYWKQPSTGRYIDSAGYIDMGFFKRHGKKFTFTVMLIGGGKDKASVMVSGFRFVNYADMAQDKFDDMCILGN